MSVKIFFFFLVPIGFLFLISWVPLTKAIHRSSRVGVVPDSNSTQNFRMGENETRNRPEMLVDSSSSGLIGFWVVPIDFRFCCRCCYFAEFIKIWSIFGQIR